MAQATVTVERIEASLLEQGYSTSRLDNGVLSGIWNGQEINISCSRDWLRVETSWDPARWSDVYSTLPEDTQLELATLACEQWNSTHVQPRAYPLHEPTGWFINLDVVAGCRHGWNDQQLTAYLTFALTAAVMGAEDVSAFLPPLV
ncbi:hypothetical protein [Boudabousia marimammalium]|uniref:YbjN domain-containing protein n=1 Tax=Boudabousia marimammalium TaxID=156892 RepID=A0A1Q5PP27_9ACTO|nr:hypothetical protein [Boudabousia marimammalium]OKL49262.1 hypothetical protein BM477_04550 [Boudabousia marimammalium]